MWNLFKRKNKIKPKIRVYLAGNMDSVWRAKAIRELLDSGYEVTGPKQFLFEKDTKQGQINIIKRNCKAMENADIVMAWMDSEDSYGTIFELGQLTTISTPIYLGFNSKLPNGFWENLWLIRAYCTTFETETVEQFIVSVDRYIKK